VVVAVVMVKVELKQVLKVVPLVEQDHQLDLILDQQFNHQLQTQEQQLMRVMLVDQVLQPLTKVVVEAVPVVLQLVNQCLQLVLLELVD
tara:strand:- start:354 stop:620 length:267 start_codon:yes stop_codon:yes gene_type:complete